MSVSNTYFACSETPVSLTTDQIATVKRNQTVDNSYKITAMTAGSGTLSVVPDGFLIDGSSTNSLSVSGTNCSWIETRLVIPGAHVLEEKTGVAELQIYFKNDTRPTDLYCVVFPVLEGKGRGTAYFASLGILQRSKPLFTSLWTESTGFLQYIGKDMRDRTEAFCKTDARKINYFVSTETAFMDTATLTRLKSNLGSGSGYVAGPPKAKAVAAKLSLISYIPSIQITGPSTATKTVGNGYVETAQVKCRPLNHTRDISGSMIYVGGRERRGDSSLDKELAKAADFSGGFEEPTATVQGSDLETILGIVLGVVIGVVVVAFFVVWVLRKETNYLGTLKLYSSSGFQQASKLAESTWQKLTPEPCKKAVAKAVALAKVGNP